VSTIQGRGWIGTATITGTRDGEVLAYELDALCDMGAYSQNFTVAIPFLGVFVGSGQYKFPTRLKLDCVTTNTQTTDAYRGAGRPEAIYYLERIVDAYAREIGMDGADVRMKNFIPNEAFPAAVSPAGFAIDTGDYGTNLQAMLDLPEYAEMKAERDRLRGEGKLAGFGLSTYVEVCGFGPSGLVDLGFSWAEYGVPSAFNGSGLVRVNPDGTANVIIGTGPSGQGHQTTWSQIVSQQTGIEMDKIRVTYGDTKEAPISIGSFGSRSAAVDGSAAFEAAAKCTPRRPRSLPTCWRHPRRTSGSPTAPLTWRVRPTSRCRGRRSPRWPISRTSCRTAWRAAWRLMPSSARPTRRGRSGRWRAW
jgi:aerobic carbon-monoxide dehydrogenase large subunit